MKKTRLSALLLILCLLLTACGGAAKPPEQPPEQPAEARPADDPKTLVIAIQDEVVGLDVQQIAMENMVHDLLFEPLVVYSSDLTELYPAFAESFTETDKYLEFVLPADAKFSNGDPVDAAALKASTDRFLRISEYASDLEPITSVEVINERTVRYNLSAPAPYIWANIASLYGGIVNVSAARKMGEWEFNRAPVANGMYYVDNWIPADRLILKRNPYFHTNNPMLQNKEAPPFETIIVRFIPDDNERMRELDAGNVDIVYNAPTARKITLDANALYTVYSYMQPGICYLNLQTEKGILAEEAVRQALTYAVDRDAISKTLGGIVTPSFSFISEAQFGFSRAEEAKLAAQYAHDPAHAKELLAEAGWRDTDGDGVADKGGTRLRLEMMIPSDNTSFKAAGPILQQQFADVGVETQIVEYEADYIKELMREDEYTIGARSIKWVDPDILYYCFTGDSGYPWDDPELTKLIVDARYITDPEQRAEAYAAVSDRLTQDFKAISLFADNYIIVTRSNVKGVFVTTDGRTWFSDAVKE